METLKDPIFITIEAAVDHVLFSFLPCAMLFVLYIQVYLGCGLYVRQFLCARVRVRVHAPISPLPNRNAFFVAERLAGPAIRRGGSARGSVASFTSVGSLSEAVCVVPGRQLPVELVREGEDCCWLHHAPRGRDVLVNWPITRDHLSRHG